MAKTFTGVVASDRGDKTIVVTVATRKTHPIYKKQYTTSKRFMAHDEQNEAKAGDTVTIAETRPLSARKRFMLVKIVERATIRHEEEVATEPTHESKKKAAEEAAEEQV
jgi:small subunit ribosomal protein S17